MNMSFEKMSGRLIGGHQPSAHRAITPRESFPARNPLEPSQFSQAVRDVAAVLAAALLVVVTGLAISASLIILFFVAV